MLISRLRTLSNLTLFGAALGASACSSDDQSKCGACNGGGAATPGAGAGGAGASGGTTGGAGGSGGASGSTGAAAGTAGSSAGSGGGSGGAGRGGGAGTGGAGSGGAGGESGAAGGDDGGSAGSGVAGAGGGAGSGGTAGSGGAISPLPGMNFFVTSAGMPAGGKLGSLDAADAFCKSLATAVSPELGAKTWRAYLSTSAVDARDRIGTGPWRNQAGVVIAPNLTDLHAQGAGEALDDTWPPADVGIALDETGAELANSVHDILTGSNADGSLLEGNTCNDWTSDSEDDTAGVGHSNRDGGGRPPSFNATHTVGCAPFTSNYQDGTVSSGGGRGSLYCFALEPSSGP